MRVGKEAIQQEEMELHKNLLEKFGEIVKASFNQNRLEIAIKSLDTCKQLLLKIIKSF